MRIVPTQKLLANFSPHSFCMETFSLYGLRTFILHGSFLRLNFSGKRSFYMGFLWEQGIVNNCNSGEVGGRWDDQTTKEDGSGEERFIVISRQQPHFNLLWKEVTKEKGGKEKYGKSQRGTVKMLGNSTPEANFRSKLSNAKTTRKFNISLGDVAKNIEEEKKERMKWSVEYLYKV